MHTPVQPGNTRAFLLEHPSRPHAPRAPARVSSRDEAAAEPSSQLPAGTALPAPATQVRLLAPLLGRTPGPSRASSQLCVHGRQSRGRRRGGQAVRPGPLPPARAPPPPPPPLPRGASSEPGLCPSTRRPWLGPPLPRARGVQPRPGSGSPDAGPRPRGLRRRLRPSVSRPPSPAALPGRRSGDPRRGAH